MGVDQILWILTGLYTELGDDRYRPAPLLRRMVYAGRLGRAAGRGFYRYRNGGGEGINTGEAVIIDALRTPIGRYRGGFERGEAG